MDLNGACELTTTVDPSYVIRLIRKLLPTKNGDQSPDQIMEDAGGDDGPKDDPREEAGCVLWDLAANESIAELMVDNFIIEVLGSILQVPLSNRLREISTGILANLSFHKRPAREVAANGDLLRAVVEQLCLTDTQTLVETCRLLNVGLHSEKAEKWIQTITSDDVLERLLWIAENTLNESLSEKVLELLRTMVDSSKNTAAALLPHLIRLGIVRSIKAIISSQLSLIENGSFSSRDVVLDLSLQVALEISLSDSFCALLADDEEFSTLIMGVIRLSWKDDLAASAVTTIVLLANLVAESRGLAHRVSSDGELVERLISLLPGIYNDRDARNALWSILGIVCKCVELEKDGDFCSCIHSLASSTRTLVNDLKDDDDAFGSKSSFETKLGTLRHLSNIFKAQLASHPCSDESSIRDAYEIAKAL